MIKIIAIYNQNMKSSKKYIGKEVAIDENFFKNNVISIISNN